MIEQTARALNLSCEPSPCEARLSRTASRDVPPSPVPAAANENALEPDAATRLAAEALAREKARARREKARAAERRRWLMLLVTVLALLTGLKLFAADVARLLPGASRLYQALGVRVPPPRLDMETLLVRWVPTPDGGRELAISGRIVNRTGQRVAMAPVSLDLLDPLGRSLYHWRIGKGARVLADGAQARFHTRLGAVPARVASVRVRLKAAN